MEDGGVGSEILDLQSGAGFPSFFLQGPRENAFLVGLHLAERLKCTCKEVSAVL